MSNVTLTTKDGIKITGPVEKVRELVGDVNFTSAVDPNLWYLSKSKGLIKIRNMASLHIRNAILVRVKEWTDGLRDAQDPGEFMSRLMDGPLGDKTIKGLVGELERRNKWGHDWSHTGYKY